MRPWLVEDEGGIWSAAGIVGEKSGAAVEAERAAGGRHSRKTIISTLLCCRYTCNSSLKAPVNHLQE